jgi:DNA replication protein DnaC
MDKKTKDYYLYCGIKSLWHNKTFDDFTNDDEALGIVRNYLDRYPDGVEGLGLYLYGSNGTGKTHLLACSMKELLNRGYKVRMFSMDEIVDKFTAGWYSDEERRDLNNVLRNIDFLAIDEFGKNVDKTGKPVPLPDLVKRVVESVIRYRVQMGKPLWIASNTDPKYVRDVFSEDIGSLLNEAVVGVCVRGKDYRKVIQKQLKDKLV